MIRKILKYVIYFVAIAIIFDIGRNFGKKQSEKEFLKAFKYQSDQIDSIQIRLKSHKVTYDSIKKSPCFNQNTKK